MLNVKAISKTINTDLGNLVSVDFENMYSPNGNQVPNQFTVFISGENGTLKVFKSYRSIIAVKVNGVIVLDESKWDYSNTTLKYLKEFLGTRMAKKDIVAKIDSGEFKLADLNVG